MKYLLTIFALTVALPLFAQNNQTNPQEELVTVPKSMLTPNQIQQAEMQSRLGKISEYAGLGQEIGIAVNEGLGALTDQATSFSETDLGLYVMFLIGWKVVGTDFVQLVVGIPFWIFATLVCLWSYRGNCMTRRVCVKVTGEGKDKVKEYQVLESEPDRQWAHALVYGVVTVISLMVIFI